MEFAVAADNVLDFYGLAVGHGHEDDIHARRGEAVAFAAALYNLAGCGMRVFVEQAFDAVVVVRGQADAGGAVAHFWAALLLGFGTAATAAALRFRAVLRCGGAGAPAGGIVACFADQSADCAACGDAVGGDAAVGGNGGILTAVACVDDDLGLRGLLGNDDGLLRLLLLGAAVRLGNLIGNHAGENDEVEGHQGGKEPFHYCSSVGLGVFQPVYQAKNDEIIYNFHGVV